MSSYIYDEVQKLIKRCKSRNPFEIADEVHLNIVYADLGSLKGMYKYLKRNRYAVINNNLEEHLTKIVCAHELGHDILHRKFAMEQGMWEYMLYDMTARPEYEANLFAAELLISDNDILYYVNDGYDIKQIASMLCTDINLVAIKLSAMNLRGYNFDTSLLVKSDFLK